VIVLNTELLKKWSTFFKDKSDESKILVSYRFISFIITSVFYFSNDSENDFMIKVVIIGCILVSSIILSYLYPIFEKSQKGIKTLLIIEIVGNTLLLVPTGGINSPFIWYSLNTILISLVFLKKGFGWVIFLMYFICYGIIMKYFTNNNVYVSDSIIKDSNLLLSFIMMVAAFQVIVISINKTKETSKRLEETNIQLKIANNRILESIDHIKELYQSVSILTNQGNIEGIIKLSFDHIKRITKTNVVFYYDIKVESNKMLSSVENYSKLNLIEEHILKYIDNIEFNIPCELCLPNTKFLIINVGNNYSTYGVLGMEITTNQESIIYENSAYQLQFLSELLSNAFERLTLEEVNDRLLISEEQNRIANEIHDSVLQRLFSLSCGMFSTIKNLSSCNVKDIEDDLNVYRNTIDLTMKELRDKIYGLSWKKTGYSSFSADIKRYIDDIKRFNNVSIPFSIYGSLEILTTEQKKALYRMICEGLGNAVRHGKAKNIEIKLEISAERTVLSIIDDGVGFDTKEVMLSSINGLGLQNLHQLSEILHGEINIESKRGTKLTIIFPNMMLKGEAAI
jgi:signal transduction histidine kinase